MAADIRIARKDAGKIGLPEVTLGVLPGTGGTQRLGTLVGKSRAIELMVTGDTSPSRRRTSSGIVNEVVDATAEDCVGAGDGVRAPVRPAEQGVEGGGPHQARRSSRAGSSRSSRRSRSSASCSSSSSRARTRRKASPRTWRSASRSSRGSELSGRDGPAQSPSQDRPLHRRRVRARGVRQALRDDEPGDGETIARGRRGRPRGRRPRGDGARASAFDSGPWAAMKPRERGRILRKAADLLLARADEFGRVETLDNGKPIFESAKIDMPTAADALSLLRRVGATSSTGDTFPARPDAFSLHAARAGRRRRRDHAVELPAPPRGVEDRARARRWATRSSSSRRRSRRSRRSCFARAAREAGLPAGALNVVPGPGAIVGAALVEHPGVDKIAFTGSTEAGKTILRARRGAR